MLDEGFVDSFGHETEIPEPWDDSIERRDCIQLPGSPREDVDWRAAASALRPAPGCVAVEMDYEAASMGVIHLPETVGRHMRPDRGTVIAAGAGVELVPGDVVAVDGYDGVHVGDLVSGDYRAKSEVRFYGHLGLPYWRSVKVLLRKSPDSRETIADVCEVSVPQERLPEQVELDVRGFDPRHQRFTGDLRPLGSNVLLKKDPLRRMEGRFYLPDALHGRQGTATVIAVGSKVEPWRVRVGARVFYSLEHVRNFIWMGEDDLGVIDAEYIWGEVDEEPSSD